MDICGINEELDNIAVADMTEQQAHRLLRENQLAWKKEGTKIRRKQRRALKASKRRHEMGMNLEPKQQRIPKKDAPTVQPKSI
ncbi:Polyprotein [Caenorhabditis elegans]|uniref:Polyprotein n=2 Tax=Caenorhabditis elegans TaxID=6239 RepID=D7SFN3_CAEEL|nr:Polyprotein [Caenorhabditis elegans]CBM41189.1 Polyprotein [Caenorhabditis elegans]|eukprot:NP_001256199.1 Uncharacterized protein CELE_C12D8.21 [Caenorhabditis elegans]